MMTTMAVTAIPIHTFLQPLRICSSQADQKEAKMKISRLSILLFQQFVQRVNSQLPYNKGGTVNAIPIITYHNLTYSNQIYNELPFTIMVTLFAQMMKYQHNNGFRVLTINQLGYDTTNNFFYIKNLPSPNYATTTTTATAIANAEIGRAHV